MVQLKPSNNADTAVKMSHFNSIMVQLKPSFDSDLILLSALFQFHNGTIKTFQ